MWSRSGQRLCHDLKRIETRAISPSRKPKAARDCIAGWYENSPVDPRASRHNQITSLARSRPTKHTKVSKLTCRADPQDAPEYDGSENESDLSCPARHARTRVAPE